MHLKIQATIVLLCLVVTAIRCGDYHQVDGRKYYTSYPDMRNWYQAKRFCTYMGMYLVDVHSDAENKRILSVINSTETTHGLPPSDWWTSGTELGSTNDYYWDTTGHAFLYKNWEPKQPDKKYPEENCIGFYHTKNHGWNDARCILECYFICRDTFEVPSFKTKDCGLNAVHGHKIHVSRIRL